MLSVSTPGLSASKFNKRMVHRNRAGRCIEFGSLYSYFSWSFLKAAMAHVMSPAFCDSAMHAPR